MPEGDYPVIIVGSGFGGSIAAYNLAQVGVRSLVLERGRWWSVADPTRESTFPTLPSVMAGDGRATWLREQARGNAYMNYVPEAVSASKITTGLLEVIDELANPHDRSPAIRAEGIAPVAATGVGGGSLVYNGISYTPLKEAWDAAFPSAELPFMQQVWRELNEQGHFERVLAMIKASPVPADVLRSAAFASTRWMQDLAIAAGYPVEDGSHATKLRGTVLPPLAVDWDAVRDELAGRRAPSAILGEAWWGLNSGAKRSLDKPDHYLGLAIATGKAQVKALHTVTRIRFDPRSELFTLDVICSDEDYRELERFSLTTRHVIMSAGSLGTTKLLVRARDTGDLPELNAHVGTRWSSNGNCNAFRFVGTGAASQGGPAGIKLVNYDDPRNPVVLENLPMRVPAAFAKSQQLSPFVRAILNIGLGIPTATGRFRYDAATDTVVLTWPPEASDRVYDKFVSMMRELGEPTFIIERAASLRGTAHPLGGVPLGLATDLDCRVHGYDHLYAVDGSIVPGSGAATNPSVLICALAQRSMDKITTRIQNDLVVG
jgi:cholesterol oxidase